MTAYISILITEPVFKKIARSKVTKLHLNVGTYNLEEVLFVTTYLHKVIFKGHAL